MESSGRKIQWYETESTKNRQWRRINFKGT